MKAVTLSLILAIGSHSPAFAFASDGDLNQRLRANLVANPITKDWAHKIPDFYFADDRANLVNLSDSVVEDLRFSLAAPFSTLSKQVLDERTAISVNLLNRLADEISTEGISQAQALDLMNQVAQDPVVGLQALDTYDPIVSGVRTHGFCFGRADFIYFKLRQAGVAKASMRKLFQVGAISGDATFGKPWSNHIVTLVKAKEGGWWAIDPFYKMVVHPADWIAKNNSVAMGNRTFVYLGNVERVAAQGGDHTYAGVQDTSFPVSRSRVTVDGKPVEQVSQPKLTGFYMKYYNDMFKELICANKVASNPMNMCDEVGWDCPSN